MPGSISSETVRHLVNFQKTGENALFEAFWADSEPFVEAEAASWLKRHFVTHRFQADEAAVDHVKQRVACKILMLPGKSGQAGWYDAERFGWKADSLRGWLHNVIRNEAVEHCKLFHGLGRKGITIVAFGDLELNGAEAVESVLKPATTVDFDGFELRQIVAECLAAHPAKDRSLYEMLFVEGFSQREVAVRLGVSAPTVCHRWAKLRAALEAGLAARGIDATWLGHAA